MEGLESGGGNAETCVAGRNGVRRNNEGGEVWGGVESGVGQYQEE